MQRIKAIKHEEAAKVLLAKKIVHRNEYIQRKVASLVEDSSSVTEDCLKKIEGNALQKSLLEIEKDLETFIRALFHEPVAKEEDEDEELKEEDEGRDERPKTAKTRNSGRGEAGKKVKTITQSHREVPPMKSSGNRKGQRARRAEWERLYGDGARHLQRPSETVTAPRYKKDEMNESAPKKKDRQPSERLHPSWEAKRQQKEQMKLALSSSRPTNKRIKFTDDGDE